MIDLVRRKEQLQIWTDKDAGIKSAYIWKGSWARAKREDLYSLTLGDLFAGRVRLMGEMVIDSRKVCIVTDSNDEQPVRVKYPNAVVLNITQLLGYLKKTVDEEREDIFPKLMMTFTVFPEAQVVA